MTSSISQETIIIESTVKICCDSCPVIQLSFSIKFSSKIDKLKTGERTSFSDHSLTFSKTSFFNYRKLSINRVFFDLLLKTGNTLEYRWKRRETSLTKIYLSSVKISNFVFINFYVYFSFLFASFSRWTNV